MKAASLMKKKTFQWSRIIVFRQGRIGDTLVVFPVIEALHELYPQARIVYCTQFFRKKSSYLQGYDITKLSPYIDETVTYNFEDSVFRKFLELKRKLRAGKNDLLIYLPYSRVERRQVIRDFVFFKAVGFKHMICFKQTWDWTYLYEKKNIELPKETQRISELIATSDINLKLPQRCLLKYDMDIARRLWDKWGLNGKEVVAMCPGSRMQSKRWPAERYIEVGREWYRRTKMSLVIVGGVEESDMAEEIISHWPGYGFSACTSDIETTASVLSRVKCYCGNDTGAMHLAALLGVPCVAVFSSRASAKLWYPWGDNHVILQKDIKCRNCERENCYTTPPLCLENISTELVLNALAENYKKELESNGHKQNFESFFASW